jgi:hypothetical protein
MTYDHAYAISRHLDDRFRFCLGFVFRNRFQFGKIIIARSHTRRTDGCADASGPSISSRHMKRNGHCEQTQGNVLYAHQRTFAKQVSKNESSHGGFRRVPHTRGRRTSKVAKSNARYPSNRQSSCFWLVDGAANVAARSTTPKQVTEPTVMRKIHEASS